MCRKRAEIMPLEPIYLVSFLTVFLSLRMRDYLRSDPTRMSAFSTDLWHEHDVLDQLLTSGMSPSRPDHPVVDRKTDSCRCWRRLRATVIVIRSGASTATSLASRPAVVGAGGDGAFADSSQQPHLMSPFPCCACVPMRPPLRMHVHVLVFAHGVVRCTLPRPCLFQPDRIGAASTYYTIRLPRHSLYIVVIMISIYLYSYIVIYIQQKYTCVW